MGDAGEGLIDAESRIQERMEELERKSNERAEAAPSNQAALREIESLRLAKAELDQQLKGTTHEARRAQIAQAVAEIDRRMTDAKARLG